MVHGRSYFALYGSFPLISRHAMQRMNMRNISLERLRQALLQPASTGTAPGTLWFVDGKVTVVVDEISGNIITVLVL
jgi:hypothetical protein